MNENVVSSILSFTLEARAILEEEVGAQLEGIYGFLPDGTFSPAKNYPAIKALTRAAEVRSRLEQYVEEQHAAHIAPKKAREKLIREASFTWLNRLVAFKMMESRSLLRKNSIAKPDTSSGFKMWIAEKENAVQLEKFNAGDLPENLCGEGPRQEAYREYILSICAQLSSEIRILFDPDTISSCFFPRPRALNALIEKLSKPEISEAWAVGNEETIGWVYQFFSSEEKKAVFDKLYQKKQKISSDEIPAATELFTPRWIVRWLVHNSLGRYWIGMHPDSGLKDELDYFVPTSDLPSIPVKSVKEVHFLDPSCGTMHFGLVAFNIFVSMYKEEMANAGKPGWPIEKPVGSLEEIPAAIIAHNLHGLDIDLRAVQLSALTLFLRAKSLNPQAALRESNLACASVHIPEGRLESFIKSSGIKSPIIQRVLKSQETRLKESEYLGSLLPLENDIKRIIDEERKSFEKETEHLDFNGKISEKYGDLSDWHTFWETLDRQVEEALAQFVQHQPDKGHDRSIFVGETIQGLRFADILSKKYDVVATNPPYLSRRNMNASLADRLSSLYPNSKSDLYAAFIDRCSDLLNDNGVLAMITQQSFMFISSYEDLRSHLRKKTTVDAMLHLGPRAFDTISGEKVNTTAFVLRTESDETKRNEHAGIYFRLVKEPDGERKRTRFEQAVSNMNSGTVDSLVYSYKQVDFDAIPGSPWVYWMSLNLRNVFKSFAKLSEIAQPRQGLATADNFRFLRYWWECGFGRIYFNCKSQEECLKNENKWIPYMKGGSYRKWYGNLDYCINYWKNGYELKAWADPLYNNSGWSRIIKSPDYYFKSGITFSNITSSRISFRYMPEGFSFDHGGNCIFVDNKEKLFSLLGILNSMIINHLLYLVNPTINIYIEDLKRIPLPNLTEEVLEKNTIDAIDKQNKDNEEIELTYDFISPPEWKTGVDDIIKRHQELTEIERSIDNEVYKLYGISEEDRALIEAELAEGSLSGDESIDADDNTDESASDDASDKQDVEILTKNDLARMWIGYAIGIVMGRFQPGIKNALGRGNFGDKTAKALRDLADDDGILVMDKGHPDDIAARVIDALRIMLGDADTTDVIKEVAGDGPADDMLRRYFERTYFKEHIKQYRKRPVYWLLQSPAKKYGVWLFHERLTGDSLYRINTEYVQPKINWTESRLRDARTSLKSAQGRDKRSIESDIDQLEELLADLKAFSAKIKEIAAGGYIPRIDDGVLLNMAPLWELVPSWQTEPRKAWEELEAGKYDWAHHAMDYWPARVKEKCKTNKSFAIAHGCEDLYVEPAGKAPAKAKKAKKK